MRLHDLTPSVAYRYRPVLSELEVTHAILDALVVHLLGGDLEPLVAYLEERVGPPSTPA